MTVPEIRLTDDVAIPQLGFGVFQVPADETERAVTTALEAGYRHIDTAAAYGNEEGVGAAIAKSGIARDELFITTKLWNSDQGYDSTLKAFDASVAKLGVEQLDLYLIHWPLPKRDKYLDTWRAFEKLQADGRIRAIGVSNFTTEHLQRVFDNSDVTPVINQIELHPYLQQSQLRAFHDKHGIATEAWSPLGQGKGLLDDKTLGELAAKYDRTPAQIVLRWHIQLGNVVIPKSVTPSRIAENIAVFDFELADEDLAAIERLNRDERVGPDPETFDVA